MLVRDALALETKRLADELDRARTEAVELRRHGGKQSQVINTLETQLRDQQTATERAVRELSEERAHARELEERLSQIEADLQKAQRAGDSKRAIRSFVTLHVAGALLFFLLVASGTTYALALT
ncbi:MAG: hypothetical protein ACRDFW_12510, partial [bacterium]